MSEIEGISSDNENFESFDQALRPDSFDGYIGQDTVKENLAIIIEAAKRREESIDHILFHGQAGLGKTTLALIVAKALNAPIRVTSGPTLKKVGDLAAILSNLEPNSLLFVDEAHRLNRMVEEFLYPAMESRKLHLVVGKGPGARTLSLDLPPFTLVAATTRADLLSSPLRSRFGATFKLDFYNEKDIREIIRRSSGLLGVGVESEAIDVLALASRATPRVANRLLKRARDVAEVKGDGVITEEIAKDTLRLLDIDSIGLEPHDRVFLKTIVETFNGGPVGIDTLSAALSEERAVIEDVYEPYLMRIGFLKRTPQGREVADKALNHLSIKTKEQEMLDKYLK